MSFSNTNSGLEFIFKRWYWGVGHDVQPPSWWANFCKDKPFHLLADELSDIAKVTRHSNNRSVKVVFNTESDLSFFILKWS